MDNIQTDAVIISEKLIKEAEEFAEARLLELTEKRKKRVRSLIRVCIMLALTSLILIFTAIETLKM